MIIEISWNNIFQEFMDTWLPLILPMALLFLFFLIIAFFKKGDKDE